jgi:hypothetical protein
MPSRGKCSIPVKLGKITLSGQAITASQRTLGLRRPASYALRNVIHR